MNFYAFSDINAAAAFSTLPESKHSIHDIAATMFGGDVQQAQSHLGTLYGLTPKCVTSAAPTSTDNVAPSPPPTPKPIVPKPKAQHLSPKLKAKRAHRDIIVDISLKMKEQLSLGIASHDDIRQSFLDDGNAPDDVTAALTVALDVAQVARMADAKQANSIPFRNYAPVEIEVEKRGKTVKDIAKEPRTHADMLADLSRRFLGFPRRVGDGWMFDHDRDTNEIVHIGDADDLLSWIARRGKLNPDFGRGDAMVTARQLKASIRSTCRRYEAISGTPDWPRRDDVYYKHGPIPAPDPDHVSFWGFVDFFLPATPQDRALIAAFCCAPLWYIPGIDRPSWIIDSKDGPGCGKTTFVEIVADMYGHAPISTSRQELTNKIDVLIKRCVSQEGRKARVMLIDNIVGVFNSSELADLITRKAITGIPPYGRGEEVRPNNLIFAITANSATVSHDIADRSFYINLAMPEKDNDRASWKSRVMAYIERHRLEIVADIIDMLSTHTPFAKPPRLRFAAFEQSILQPCCQSEEMYDSVCALLKDAKEESNVEQDQARSIEELFIERIVNVSGLDSESPVFIHSKLVNSWGADAIKDDHDYKGKVITLVRQLAKAGFLKRCDKEISRWPTSSRHNRVSGIAWNFHDAIETCTVLRKRSDGSVSTDTM